jgi:hypothetical protein
MDFPNDTDPKIQELALKVLETCAGYTFDTVKDSLQHVRDYMIKIESSISL